MAENTVPENLCQERMKRQDERFARDKQRIDNIEHRLEDVEHEQSDAGKALLKLTTMEEQDRETLKDHDRRIGAIEQQPKKRMDSLWSIIVSAAVSGVVWLVQFLINNN